MTSLQSAPNMARPNQVPMNMNKVKEKLQVSEPHRSHHYIHCALTHCLILVLSLSSVTSNILDRDISI